MSVKTLTDVPGVSDPPEEPRPRFTLGALRRAPHTGLIAVLIVVVVATALRTDSFATTTNLINVLRQVSVTAVIAAGLTLLMTAGGMDFSMGSNVSVTTAVGAQLLSHGHSTAFTVIASVLLATAVGLVNGLVVTFTNVAPFVVTLATATLLDGVALLVLDGLSVSIGTRMFSLGNDKVLGVPYLLIVAVLVLVATALVMRFTVFGRDAFAIGGNEHVARLSGINVTARKLTLYAVTGALSGLAGVMLLSRLGASSPGTGGLTLQLTAVAAVVIGGTSLAGGHGTVVGTALGVLLLGVVANALNLVQVSSYFQQVSVGGVLLVAAIANELHKARSARH
ncbi:ABC transporter permease [Streptomyces sp. NPDC059837]|uniref:ABC transporter permease n=1 Tax=unclassified Streptomyces TaxID=2593676 RepID=UPI002251DB14|nr:MULTISPECIES: ABC transporter permease [unclassified Streptomyces]MCX4405132.1 ABC transporter permease [Streptomyces sp. NBC_01764]MCX5190319.1 ABC transporter permease [Streptomyces sp. NBC_00268]